MSEADLVAAFNVGLAAIRPEMSVFCPGEMGIGNTASAAAILAALYKGGAVEWTGAGSGLSGEYLARKVAVVQLGLDRHTLDDPDPLEIVITSYSIHYTKLYDASPTATRPPG